MSSPSAPWFNERVLQDEALQLRGVLYGAAPVQAEGTIAGHCFYFRARWDGWTIAVAREPDVDPVDIYDHASGFYRSAEVPQASHLPFDEAESIVRACAREFLAELRA